MTKVIIIEDHKHQTIKKGELPSLIQETQPSLQESCASLYLDRKANANHVRHPIMNEVMVQMHILFSSISIVPVLSSNYISVVYEEMEVKKSI